jgi:hypothetical protein
MVQVLYPAEKIIKYKKQKASHHIVTGFLLSLLPRTGGSVIVPVITLRSPENI